MAGRSPRSCLSKAIWLGLLFVMILGYYIRHPNLPISVAEGETTTFWAKSYGGWAFESANSIHQTSDGGYIVAGYTGSFRAESCNILVLKLDLEGNIAWQKTYGGSDADVALAIQETDDGGYIVAGNTASFGAGVVDFWLLKLTGEGDVPPLGRDTTATITDTGALPQDSSALSQSTSATITETLATQVDTNANYTISTRAATGTYTIRVMTWSDWLPDGRALAAEAGSASFTVS